jgi:ABC-2 type transport system ATP-binding protein
LASYAYNQPQVIQVSHLNKKFGKQTAVDNLSFTVETGKVTGFLGPNGAGKSTTMRLMLGLDSGKGRTTYGGKLLHTYPQPAKVVGILLEAKAFHPTRSARNHLKVLAAAGSVPDSRVDEALDVVGLKDVAKKAPGKFSLGMAQRLGIAAAILGNPKYLILDEPANGLDPEGIAWLRQFIKDYAKDGRGVLVSSHLLSEMSQMADNVVVIGKGKLIADTSIKGLLTSSAGSTIFVRATSLGDLEKTLKKASMDFKKSGDGLAVTKASTDEVGKLAYANKITLLELTRHTASLEDVFLELTEDSQEFVAQKEGAKK